jgi:DNA-binding response OmpR family regulator
MADALGDHGWEVVPCAEPLVAHQLLRDTNPDLIVLDLRIEGQYSGWDLLTFLQLHPTLHRVPVILCTAAIDEINQRSAWLQEHGIATLIKPFELDELYALIEERLQTALPAVTTA